MMPRSRLTLRHLLLLFLTLPPSPSIARRGGSHTDVGGGGEGFGDSGGDGSDDPADSTDPTNPGANTCERAVHIQEGYVYQHPGSYYNGSLTVTHTFHEIPRGSDFLTNHDAVCTQSNLGTKTYTFPDAVFHIGGPLDGNDTNSVYWALRAFIPFQNDRYSFRPARGSKREIVRIESAAYNYSLMNFYYLAKVTESWNTAVTRDARTSSFNLTSHYNKRPLIDTAGVAFPTADSESTSNWVTLADICTNGFDRVSTDSTNINLTEWGDYYVGMTFFKPPASASISGIGTSDIQFSLTDGQLNKSFFGAASYEPCTSVGEDFPFYRWGRYKSRGVQNPNYDLLYSDQFYMNLTASFSLKFEGKLQEDRSWKFKNESGSTMPAWDLGDEPKIKAGSEGAVLWPSRLSWAGFAIGIWFVL